ncbi:hypothetical protein [Microvirga roseola]|nr:hypothetical protein [Microvirga roseola]
MYQISTEGEVCSFFLCDLKKPMGYIHDIAKRSASTIVSAG